MTTRLAYTILLTMMLVNLLSTAGIALPYPILAPLFTETAASGLTRFAGLPPELLLAGALAVYPLGMLIGSSFIGALSDIYGRKPVLRTTLILSVVGYLCTAWAVVSESYLLFILARFATGLCEGNISIARAIVADLEPQIDKTRAFSWLFATSYSGWLIGPLSGGYLMALGPEVPFIVASGAMALALVLVAFVVPLAAPPRMNQRGWLQQARQTNSLSLLKHNDVRQCFIMYLCLLLGLNALYQFTSLWLVEQYQMSSQAIGETIAVQTLAMTSVSLLLVERFKRWFGLVTTVITAIGLLALVLLSAPWFNADSVWPYYAVTGTLIASYNGLLPVYISDRFAEHGQGRIMGLIASTFVFASMTIAAFGGIISLWGAHWSLFSGGILMLMALLQLVWIFYKDGQLSLLKWQRRSSG